MAHNALKLPLALLTFGLLFASPNTVRSDDFVLPQDYSSCIDQLIGSQFDLFELQSEVAQLKDAVTSLETQLAQASTNAQKSAEASAAEIANLKAGNQYILGQAMNILDYSKVALKQSKKAKKAGQTIKQLQSMAWQIINHAKSE